jgi:hypothetical protein
MDMAGPREALACWLNCAPYHSLHLRRQEPDPTPFKRLQAGGSALWNLNRQLGLSSRLTYRALISCRPGSSTSRDNTRPVTSPHLQRVPDEILGFVVQSTKLHRRTLAELPAVPLWTTGKTKMEQPSRLGVEPSPAWALHLVCEGRLWLSLEGRYTSA